MSNKRALQYLSRGLNVKSSFAPYGFQQGTPDAKHLSRYITNVQFERLAHDIGMWREAMREMELAWYPMRVKVQRMYMDTVDNPFIKALLDRWLELTTQRDYIVYETGKGKIKGYSEVLTQQISEQTWFDDYIEFTTMAQQYGYTLIELGDIINDGFPNISFTRRENIRPDGFDNEGRPILTSLIYSLDGVHVTEDPLIDMCNHYIPTKTNRGVSKCGYGSLYSLALLEIHLRHILEWNADYIEGYGMPIKKGTTQKQGKERDYFEDFLRSGASNQWVLLDPATADDINYEYATSVGTAWKSYENLEERLQRIASQLVLGHADAMSSTAGKLGGMQAANKDGNNISMVEKAIIAKQIKSGDFVCRKINEIFAPKMRKLGTYIGSKTLKGLIPEGYSFGLKNDAEESELKRRENTDRTQISTYVKNLNDAGFNVDVKELSDRIGLKLTVAPPERKLIEERTTDTTITKSDTE